MTKEKIYEIIEKTSEIRNEHLSIIYKKNTKQYNIAMMEKENFIFYLKKLIEEVEE